MTLEQLRGKALIAHLQRTEPGIIDALLQFARNGRWGTCGVCPRDSRRQAYPEFCEFTARYDHQRTLQDLTEAIRRHSEGQP